MDNEPILTPDENETASPYIDVNADDAYAVAYRKAAGLRSGEKKGFDRFAAVGIVVILFALIGVFATVSGAVRFISTRKEAKQQQLCDKYTTFMIPIAAIDPDGFDDISKASPEELVRIAVWRIIGFDMQPGTYDYANGELRIPASEVEAAFASYFGTQAVIRHQTVTGYGYEFAYQPSDNAYYIPLTTILPVYTPKVVSVESKGGSTVITCGLVDSDLWMQDSETGEIRNPEPDKYIRVTLRGTGNGAYVSSIQSLGKPETVPTAAVMPVVTAPAATAPAVTEPVYVPPVTEEANDAEETTEEDETAEAEETTAEEAGEEAEYGENEDYDEGY